jgi:hypothetical protein
VALLLRQQELLTENYWRHLLEVFRITQGRNRKPSLAASRSYVHSPS